MNKKINITVIALFLALIFGFGAAFWIVPDTDFSEDENRVLQTLPDVSLNSWAEGKASSQLTTYYSDQFPLRSMWVNVHAMGELAMWRGESNGVLVGKDGQLAVRRFDAYLSRTIRLENTDYTSPDHIDKGLTALVNVDQTLKDRGISLTVLLAPRTVDVTVNDYAYPSALSDALDNTIQTTLGGAKVNSIELLETFRTMHDSGEYVYYRTDHHWTTKGAYTAYAAILTSWGMEGEILPESYFTVREIPDFYGTTHARAGIPFIAPDTLEIWEASDDSRFTVFSRKGDNLETVIESGFISESYLNTKDKYGAFLDGTHSMLFIIDSEAAAKGESRPRLLLARDSFANSMVPFLARHFDICMVNLSGGMTNLSELATEYGCSRVLVVCNRENLVTSDCFVQIR